jgi:hypothetical protein
LLTIVRCINPFKYLNLDPSACFVGRAAAANILVRHTALPPYDGRSGKRFPVQRFNPAGKVRMAGPPLKLSDTPAAARSASPPLGQDTDVILGRLGYSSEQIEDPRGRGITR